MPSTPTASSVWTKLIKLVLNSKETSKRLGVRGLFEDYYDEGEDGRLFCGGEIEGAEREYSNRGVNNARSTAVFTASRQVLATVSKCDKQGSTCEADG